jgi:hypothetical protein
MPPGLVQIMRNVLPDVDLTDKLLIVNRSEKNSEAVVGRSCLLAVIKRKLSEGIVKDKYSLAWN